MTAQWVFSDPMSEVADYTWEVNPNDSTPGIFPQLQKNLINMIQMPTGQLPLLFESPDDVPQSQATGTIITQDQYIQLMAWYNLGRPFYIIDDLSNQWLVYLTQFQQTPGRKRGISFPWRTDYILSWMVLSYSPGGGGGGGGGSIAYVSGSIAMGAGADTVEVEAPSDIVNGNALYAIVYQADSGTINTPSGWTLVSSNYSSADGLAYFYRFADDEPGSYTFTSSAGYICAAVLQYSGVGSFSGVTYANQTSDTDAFVSGTISGFDGAVLLVVYCTYDGTPVATPPAGLVGLLAGNDGGEEGMEIYGTVLDSSSTTSSYTAVLYPASDTGQIGVSLLYPS